MNAAAGATAPRVDANRGGASRAPGEHHDAPPPRFGGDGAPPVGRGFPRGVPALSRFVRARVLSVLSGCSFARFALTHPTMPPGDRTRLRAGCALRVSPDRRSSGVPGRPML